MSVPFQTNTRSTQYQNRQLGQQPSSTEQQHNNVQQAQPENQQVGRREASLNNEFLEADTNSDVAQQRFDTIEQRQNATEQSIRELTNTINSLVQAVNGQKSQSYPAGQPQNVFQTPQPSNAQMYHNIMRNQLFNSPADSLNFNNVTTQQYYQQPFPTQQQIPVQASQPQPSFPFMQPPPPSQPYPTGQMQNQNVKHVSPQAPKFSPSRDNPQMFLQVFERYMRRLGYLETEWVDEIYNSLQDTAVSWYVRNRKNFITFFEFSKLFLEYFYKNAAEAEVQMLLEKQLPNESFREYFKRLEKIAIPAGVEEHRIKTAFLVGLKDERVCEFARQTFVHTNKSARIETIFGSLIDKERSIQRSIENRQNRKSQWTNNNSQYNKSSPQTSQSKGKQGQGNFKNKAAAVAEETPQPSQQPENSEVENQVDERCDSDSGSDDVQACTVETKSVRKTPCIPDVTPQQYMQTHMSEMSLAQALENNPAMCEQWSTYLTTLTKPPQQNVVQSSETTSLKTQTYKSDMYNVQLSQSQPLLYVYVKLNGHKVCAVIDTGCNNVVITDKFIQRYNLQDDLRYLNRTVNTANSTQSGKTAVLPNLSLTFFEKELQDLEMTMDSIVLNDSGFYDVLLGQSVLVCMNYKLCTDSLVLQHPKTKSSAELPFLPKYEICKYITEVPQNFSVLTTANIQYSAEQQKLFPKFPYKKFDVFLLDPPWQYYKNPKAQTPKYEQLTFKQLQQLPLSNISKENGLILMWTTAPMMKQAINLIQSYGFYYKTVLFVWVKLDPTDSPQKGFGNYTSPCCEFLLLGTKGDYTSFRQENEQVSQLIQSRNIHNSRKPTEVYALLSKLFKLNQLDNIEIFSRQPQGSEMFCHYGKEVKDFYQQSMQLSTTTINLLQILDNESSVQNGGEQYNSENFSVFLTQEELQASYEKEPLKTDQQVLEEVQVNSKDQRLLDLLELYVNIFSKGDWDLGETDLVQHEIQLVPGSVPKKQKPYKMGQLELNAVKSIVQDTLKMGVVEERASPYLHPIVLVKKPNGKYRMCINYKYLNSQTIDDKYPIPLIWFILQKLVLALFFSKLDAKSGFWQIRMALDSIYLTGFITPEGQYVYLRMPFGLKNAPATFQKLMNLILKDFIGVFVIVYIDDIIIYSNTMEEHLEHLRMVFEKLAAANIKLGGDKCEIGLSEINILGHTIRQGEILPQQEKVQAILNIRDPRNRTELRSFLGLCGYYRQFIPKFAQIAHPLYPQVGHTSQWQWTPEMSTAVDKLKREISNNCVLGMLQADKPLVLYTDFSIVGLGAVLAQKISAHKEKVIEFASRTLQKYERQLDSYCGEVLAVYWALQKFRQYILSVPFKLQIVTDNKALEWVLKLGTSSPIRKIQRWTLEIDQYAYEVKHRKGTAHVNADALSRLVGQVPQELLEQEATHSKTSVLYMEDVGDLKCKVCEQTHEDSPMLICERCGDAMHSLCANVQNIPVGPWYCDACTEHMVQNPQEDILYDQEFIELLQRQQDSSCCTNYSEVETGLSRKVQQNKLLQNVMLMNNRLYKVIDGNQLLIPTPVERQIILQEQHCLVGHSGKEKTQLRIFEQYWWPTLSRDVDLQIKSCEVCNVTNPTFSHSPVLHPTEKGSFPFQIIAVDLITNLQDETGLEREPGIPLTDAEIIAGRTRQAARKKDKSKPKGNRTIKDSDPLEYVHCIVCIDVFSKYVELGALKTKASAEVAMFLEERILCRYGTPSIVRCDQGREFMGDFDDMCKEHCIDIRRISPHNPQANGQAENCVKTVCKILRRFLLSKHYAGLRWWELLPEVQRSINITQSSSTLFTPHEILFGRKMPIIDSANYTLKAFKESFPELSSKEISEYVNNLSDSLESLQKRVKVNLQKQDQQMVEQYTKRKGTEFIFQKGQRVYLKNYRTNKLQPKVLGPFIFESYKPGNIVANVLDPDNGKLKAFNSNSLSPASLIYMHRHLSEFDQHEAYLLTFKEKYLRHQAEQFEEIAGYPYENVVFSPTDGLVYRRERMFYGFGRLPQDFIYPTRRRLDQLDLNLEEYAAMIIRNRFQGLRISYRPPPNLPVMASENIWFQLILQGLGVDGYNHFRVSLLRHYFTGIFFPQLLLVFRDPYKCASVFLQWNRLDPIWRLWFLDPLLELVPYQFVDENHLVIGNLTWSYERRIQKILSGKISHHMIHPDHRNTLAREEHAVFFLKYILPEGSEVIKGYHLRFHYLREYRRHVWNVNCYYRFSRDTGEAEIMPGDFNRNQTGEPLLQPLLGQSRSSTVVMVQMEEKLDVVTSERILPQATRPERLQYLRQERELLNRAEDDLNLQEEYEYLQSTHEGVITSGRGTTDMGQLRGASTRCYMQVPEGPNDQMPRGASKWMYIGNRPLMVDPPPQRIAEMRDLDGFAPNLMFREIDWTVLPPIHDGRPLVFQEDYQLRQEAIERQAAAQQETDLQEQVVQPDPPVNQQMNTEPPGQQNTAVLQTTFTPEQMEQLVQLFQSQATDTQTHHVQPPGPYQAAQIQRMVKSAQQEALEEIRQLSVWIQDSVSQFEQRFNTMSQQYDNSISTSIRESFWGTSPAPDYTRQIRDAVHELERVRRVIEGHSWNMVNRVTEASENMQVTIPETLANLPETLQRDITHINRDMDGIQNLVYQVQTMTSQLRERLITMDTDPRDRRQTNFVNTMLGIICNRIQQIPTADVQQNIVAQVDRHFRMTTEEIVLTFKNALQQHIDSLYSDLSAKMLQVVQPFAQQILTQMESIRISVVEVPHFNTASRTAGQILQDVERKMEDILQALQDTILQKIAEETQGAAASQQSNMAEHILSIVNHLEKLDLASQLKPAPLNQSKSIAGPSKKRQATSQNSAWDRDPAQAPSFQELNSETIVAAVCRDTTNEDDQHSHESSNHSKDGNDKEMQ